MSRHNYVITHFSYMAEIGKNTSILLRKIIYNWLTFELCFAQMHYRLADIFDEPVLWQFLTDRVFNCFKIFYSVFAYLNRP